MFRISCKKLSVFYTVLALNKGIVTPSISFYQKYDGRIRLKTNELELLVYTDDTTTLMIYVHDNYNTVIS